MLTSRGTLESSHGPGNGRAGVDEEAEGGDNYGKEAEGYALQVEGGLQEVAGLRPHAWRV